MSGQHERQGPPPDSGPVALVTTTAFLVLHLKIPIKIADLSTFAGTMLAMIISHKALNRVPHLLRLAPANSRRLLGMFRECKYAPTYSKGGLLFPFPDIDAPDCLKSAEDLNTALQTRMVFHVCHVFMVFEY